MTKSNLEIVAQLIDGEVDHDRIKNSVHGILESLGEDPSRQGLKDTPDRIARMYAEMLDGYRADPVALINAAFFDVSYDQMVIIKDIEFSSMCEHHLLPFFGRAHVAYIPRGKVIGLSKIPRVVDMFAHRLQIQELMTQQIADFLVEALQPQGVAVVVEGMHLCAIVRGVRKTDSRMITSAMRGSFLKDPRTRSEFMEHLGRSASDIL